MIRRAKDELLRSVPLIGKGIFLVWQAARGWTVAWGLLLLIQGVIPAVQVYLTKMAVDFLSVDISQVTSAAVLTRALPPIIAIGLFWIISQVVTSLIRWVRAAQTELVQDSIHSLIHDKAIDLDLAFYENPESYDLLHRARVDALSQPIALLESVGVVLQNSVTLLVLAGMIAMYAWWMPFLLIGSALPGLWSVSRYVLREHNWRLLNTANERRSRYYDWLLTDRNSAAEMRLFDLGVYHKRLFQKLRSTLREGRLKLVRDEMKSELFAGSIAWLGGIAGIVWLLMRISRGLAKLGDLVLCYQAFLQGQKLLRSLLESAGRIYRSTLFLENLFQFLSAKPFLAIPEKKLPLLPYLNQGIRFEEVTFRYPGSPFNALDNFSLDLPAGKSTAIVGHNGAGKSTLIKLLCRFYDPQTGKILIDNNDVKELDPSELRRSITVLFQEPVRYHTTASENIAMGDLTALGDQGRIQAAAVAAAAAAPIERLSNGYETVLGKWFGGAELSVGEWQRLALARAFLRNAPIIVLDEPTSAMDSWAEADWLNRFKQLTAGHTALMITHRFTTAMYADIIHVMESGKIIESGTHEHLISIGGHYAESWQSQVREMKYE
ncbi:MAG: ABC transporter ATP-binding protein [Desulfuromonadaceae bacterium]|nr:ABC transporter ATP-binding protein [Desulfuromonadaceae bacterium]MDD2855990.1 ABC transporter ATP-binding protein [Desulfuromonadaceae bacterium]